MNPFVNRKRIGYLLLLLVAVLVVVKLLILAPIDQDQSYHNFSDTSKYLMIPNFWNVISNLPFLIVGLIGLYKLDAITKNKSQYFMFFMGISLVSIGSAYYHLNPNNNTLVWDRLPMTIAFMALFSIVISEFISLRKGQLLLIPLLAVGLLSVLYWIIFNDLRVYLLVQFYPMLAIPVILLFFKSKYNFTIGYWLVLLAYILAKIFEHYDEQTRSFIGLLSGHTLKHLFASVGLFLLLYSFLKRRTTD